MKTALAHKEGDHIPFDIGGTMVTGINVNALRNLRKHLGLSEEVQVRDKITQMAETGDEIIEKLKIDIKNVSPEPASKPGLARDLGRDVFGVTHLVTRALSPLASRSIADRLCDFTR